MHVVKRRERSQAQPLHTTTYSVCHGFCVYAYRGWRCVCGVYSGVKQEEGSWSESLSSSSLCSQRPRVQYSKGKELANSFVRRKNINIYLYTSKYILSINSKYYIYLPNILLDKINREDKKQFIRSISRNLKWLCCFPYADKQSASSHTDELRHTESHVCIILTTHYIVCQTRRQQNCLVELDNRRGAATVLYICDV